MFSRGQLEAYMEYIFEQTHLWSVACAFLFVIFFDAGIGTFSDSHFMTRGGHRACGFWRGRILIPDFVNRLLAFGLPAEPRTSTLWSPPRLASRGFKHLRIRVMYVLFRGDFSVQLGEREIAKVGCILRNVLDEFSGGTIGIFRLKG